MFVMKPNHEHCATEFKIVCIMKFAFTSVCAARFSFIVFHFYLLNLKTVFFSSMVSSLHLLDFSALDVFISFKCFCRIPVCHWVSCRHAGHEVHTMPCCEFLICFSDMECHKMEHICSANVQILYSFRGVLNTFHFFFAARPQTPLANELFDLVCHISSD